MKCVFVITLVALLMLSAGVVMAGDWPNWRGPGCSGSATDCGEELVEDISQAKRVWTSEEETKPCFGGKGVTWGYSDFAVVDGKVYMAYGEGSGPLARDEFLLMKKVWTKGSGHLRGNRKPEDAEWLSKICTKVRGDDGMICWDADTGRTLWKTIFRERGVNHQFIRAPSQYSYQATPCVGTDRTGRKVVVLFGTSLRVYGLDAETGETLWESDAGPLALKFSMQFMDVCFRPGRQDWKSNARNPEEGLSYDSCPMIADGVVALNCHDKGDGASVTGLELATGRRLWTVPDSLDMYASPIRWVYQPDTDDPRSRREFFICHTGGPRGRKLNGKVAPGILKCIEARTGKVMWSLDRHGVPGGPIQSPAVQGDLVVCCGGQKDLKEHDTKGSDYATVQCYRMTPEKATLVWQWQEMKGFREGGWQVMRFTSPVIHGDKVHIATTRMFDLKTGELLDKKVGVGKYAPIASDGYLIGSGETISYRRFEPNAKNTRLSNKDQLGGPIANEDGGPAVADGRLYIRGDSRIHCVDLRKNYCSNPQPPIDPPKEPPKAGGMNELGARHFTKRQATVDALKKAGGADAAALAKLVLEADWKTRKAAAEVLQAQGTKAKAAAPRLAAALPGMVKEGPLGRVRLTAATVKAIDAAAAGKVAPQIGALLADKDEMVVHRACAALELLGEVGAPAVPGLVEVLKRGDEYLYGRAALALRAMGPAAKDAVPALATTVQDSRHGEMVAYALDALRKIGPPESLLDKLIALTMGKERDYKPSMDLSYEFFPEIKEHLISWLAGECLKETGPSVIARLTAALQEHSKIPKSRTPWLTYSVFGHFGTKAKEALPLMERRYKARPPYSHGSKGWVRVQIAKVKGETYKYISLGGYAGNTFVPLDVTSEELIDTLKGTRSGNWGVAMNELVRRDEKSRTPGFSALADHVGGKKKALSSSAIGLIGKHAAKCPDAALGKSVKALATVVDHSREGLVLPAVNSLASFGKRAAAAVESLEAHMTTSKDVEKAISDALTKIRGKPKAKADDIDDDLLEDL